MPNFISLLSNCWDSRLYDHGDSLCYSVSEQEIGLRCFFPSVHISHLSRCSDKQTYLIKGGFPLAHSLKGATVHHGGQKRDDRRGRITKYISDTVRTQSDGKVEPNCRTSRFTHSDLLP